MNETPASIDTELLYRVKDVVAAFVSNNSLPTRDLPALIAASHAALRSLAEPTSSEPLNPAPLTPAVPIKKSITADHIVCLECGRIFVSIKRHLATSHQLSPAQYRAKWQLPDSYPVVAPTYSERRSNLAKESGLGLDRGGRAAEE